MPNKINYLHLVRIWSLTTGADAITGTAGNDTITGAVDTLGSADVIIDSSTTDNDTLNAIMKANLTVTPTITKIENVNLSFDTLTGAAFDAANVTGATITVKTETFGTDGKATVSNVGSNNVTAGTGVKELTATGVTQGVVNTGSATKAAVTGGTAHDTNVKVNGNVELTSTISTSMVLETTAASTVKLVEAAKALKTLTVKGASDTTVSMTGDDLTTDTVKNELTAGKLTVKVNATATGGLDLTKVAADKIDLAANQAGQTVTVANNMNFDITAAQTGTVTVADAATATNTTLNITTAKNIGTLDVTDTSLKTVNFTATGPVAVTALTGVAGDTLNILGSGTTSFGAITAGTIDASASTGAFTATVSDATFAQEVKGSATAANTVVLSNDYQTVAYTGGSGVDNVTATAMGATALSSTGVLIAQLGAGDDSLTVSAKLLAAVAGATLTIDGGTGTDTLNLAGDGTTNTAHDISAIKTTITNFEKIKVVDAGDDITFSGKSLTGNTLTIEAKDDLVKVTDINVVSTTTDTAETIDLSNISLTNINSMTITAKDGVNTTIIGTSKADTIVSQTGADTLTGGAGKDTFKIAEGDSSAAKMDKITDFTIADDKLDIDTTTKATATGTSGVDVKAAIAGASELSVVIDANGIAKLVGASKGMVDTVGEWLAVLATDTVMHTNTGAVVAKSTTVAAFELNGNTYVTTYAFTDAVAPADDVSVVDVVELTGVTGITALSTAAAADTIVIA